MGSRVYLQTSQMRTLVAGRRRQGRCPVPGASWSLDCCVCVRGAGSARVIRALRGRGVLPNPGWLICLAATSLAEYPRTRCGPGDAAKGSLAQRYEYRVGTDVQRTHARKGQRTRARPCRHDSGALCSPHASEGPLTNLTGIMAHLLFMPDAEDEASHSGDGAMSSRWVRIGGEERRGEEPRERGGQLSAEAATTHASGGVGDSLAGERAVEDGGTKPQAKARCKDTPPLITGARYP